MASKKACKSSATHSGHLDVNVKLTKSGRTTNFQLPPHKTIEDVCKEVADEEKVSARQIIIKYTGKILNRFHSLSFLGVRPETVLKAEVVSVKKYNIYVQKENGDTFPMAIENISTVQEVNNMLTERLEIDSTNTVEMELNGKKIVGKQSSTASSVGLDEESMLKVKVVERPEEAAANKGQDHQNEQLDEAALQELLSSFVVEAGNKVEVVFSFDTTGSMSACLNQVRSKVEETTSRLLRDISDIRIGIMAHGDYCDYNNYVLRTCDLTDNREDLVRFINDVPSTGGGDSPECYEWVLKKAQDLSWTEGSARALVMIGDYTPHPPSYTDQNINWHTELDTLRDMNVKVYGVQAMMHNEECNMFYEELAERTAGTYLRFTQFSYITDMFMAVCYRESSDEQLQAYCEEVKSDGRMTEELSSMFVKLEEKPTAPSKKAQSERYIAKPWWDPSLDDGTPQYKYNEKDDEWLPYNYEGSRRLSFSASRAVDEPKKERRFLSLRKNKHSKTKSSRSKSSRSKSDDKCGIM